MTFADAGLTTPLANPIIADAGGRFGDVFAGDGNYRLRLETAGGAMIWTADPVEGSTAMAATPGAGIRNMLVNGDFSVNQRGNGTFANDTYCLDAWYVLTQTAAIGVEQQKLQDTGSPTSIRLTQSQATPQRFGVAQIIEARDCQYVRGSITSLSARIRCSVSTRINRAVLSWGGAADNVVSDVVNDWTSTNLSAGNFFNGTNLVVSGLSFLTPTAGVWTDMPLNAGMMSPGLNNAIVFFWTHEAQLQNVMLDIGNAQLEHGTQVTAFEQLPAAMQITRCQRLWRRLQSALQFPANSGSQAFSQGYVLSPPMRTTPIVTMTPTVVSRSNVDADYPIATEISANGFTVSILSANAGDSHDRGRIWNIGASL